jgi:hypothetical protein
MRVNLGRKSWPEQQLARAWATSAIVLARQPAQPHGQSLQHAEQLAEVLYRLSDLGRAAGETGAGRRPVSGQVQGGMGCSVTIP